MRSICILLGLLVTQIYYCQLPSVYQTRFGSIGDDAANSIVKETDGGYVLTGYALDPISNQSRTYAWRISNNFSMVWEKKLGNSIGNGTSIKKVFNNGYIVCGFIISPSSSYDGYLVRLNNNGDTIWTKRLGTNAWDFLNKVIVTADSGFIAVGKSYGTATFDSDAWLVKVDKNGNVVWSKLYGGFEDDELSSIEAIGENHIACGINRSQGDTAGDVYFLKVNKNGDTLKTRVIPKPSRDVCNGITKVNTNTFHITGGSIELPRTVMSNAQMGIDSNLNTINTYTNYNTFLQPFSYFTESALLSDNRIANTGASNQGFTKLDGISNIVSTNGNNIFFTFLGSSIKDEEGLSICSNFEDSSYTICGYTEGHGAIQKDVFIAKCNKNGFTTPGVFPLSSNNLGANPISKNFNLLKDRESYAIQNLSNHPLRYTIYTISGMKIKTDEVEGKTTKSFVTNANKLFIMHIETQSGSHYQKILLD